MTVAPNPLAKLQPPPWAAITQRILAVSDPIKVIIFGSHARGDYGKDSDLDLLVVLENVDSTRAASNQLRESLRGLLYPIDVIVATPEQMERYQDSQEMIYSIAQKEGKIIYERAATD